MIRAVAQDFIVKGTRSAMELPRAMAYAVERKAAETRLKRLASYDPLTQLANRQEFAKQLRKACARADRHGTMVALMIIDGVVDLPRTRQMMKDAPDEAFTIGCDRPHLSLEGGSRCVDQLEWVDPETG